MEAAANDIHAAWMARNPKSDWNAAQHVPYEQLPESEKDKDRAQVKLVQRLLSENPRREGESGQQHDERIANIFGSLVRVQTCMRAHAWDRCRACDAARSVHGPSVLCCKGILHARCMHGCMQRSSHAACP